MRFGKRRNTSCRGCLSLPQSTDTVVRIDTARLRIPYRLRGMECFGEASGAGGIRTLVQTTATRAFHMLLPPLVFESQPGKDTLLTA